MRIVARFWHIVPGSVVGTAVLQVKVVADEQMSSLKHEHSIYHDIGVQEFTLQLEF